METIVENLISNDVVITKNFLNDSECRSLVKKIDRSLKRFEWNLDTEHYAVNTESNFLKCYGEYLNDEFEVWCNPFVARILNFTERFRKKIQEQYNYTLYLTDLFFTLNEFNQSSSVHAHRNNSLDLDAAHWNLSFAFYPFAPEDIPQFFILEEYVGGLRFHKQYTLETGDLFIFPSWMHHYTSRNLSQKTKYCLAGNFISFPSDIQVTPDNFEELCKGSYLI